MIGVIANPSEYDVVREFFELFKTPWEFCERGKRYDVILCAGEGDIAQNCADTMLIYAGRELSLDAARDIVVCSQISKPRMLVCKGSRIPIYGKGVTFTGDIGVVVHDRHAGATATGRSRFGRVARIGYDLFEEVRILLTEGQPASNAEIPTLELHIALLRELIVESGVHILEIPPVPSGYRLIACLTHDVDHPSIRVHKFDHTICGFLYRALVGSLMARLRGRMSWKDLFTNLIAIARLPLVHLGLSEDFWFGFKDYRKLENGLASSYFLIPFRNCAGRTRTGVAPARRAARYGVGDLAGQMRELLRAGCEVGLHGIDAWHDVTKAREELDEVRRITDTELGVRMHWLYFDEQSPAILEEAGADYDSSLGYNQTVGYRAGTTQVFKPLVASRLLELPLHAMDTALFYPNYLNLSSSEAQEKIRYLIATATRFGGVVTVNWHDRSLAPERLWRAPYRGLLDEFKRQEAWFASAFQAVSWFRKRRSVAFESGCGVSVKIIMKSVANAQQDTPDLLLRVHDGPHVHHDVVIDGAVAEQVLDIGIKDTDAEYIAL